MHSSSVQEGKISIFNRFDCSLTIIIIQLNWQFIKFIEKIEICSIWANFCKTRSRLPSECKKNNILAIFCAISPKQAGWPLWKCKIELTRTKHLLCSTKGQVEMFGAKLDRIKAFNLWPLHAHSDLSDVLSYGNADWGYTINQTEKQITHKSNAA